MELTRKTFIRSGSAAVASLLSLPALATLSDEEIETLISNAEFSEDAVTLDVPEIAEKRSSSARSAAPKPFRPVFDLQKRRNWLLSQQWKTEHCISQRKQFA